jgi:hypothetical protein
MPKKQTTAAQKARAAARNGKKYTTALRGSSRPRTGASQLPTPDELLAEGRERICEALSELAAGEPRPRLKALYEDLVHEVQASHTAADLPRPRANFAFRRADNIYRLRWDEASANPDPVYEEHMADISACYWARRVAYEWLRPGAWDRSLQARY